MAEMTPLWLDRSRSSHTPLVGDASYDAAVVGAGITGVLTALLLARGGRSVVVLEGREVGAATTGRTTGKLSLLQGTKLMRVRRTHPASLVRAYVEANREGQAWVRRFCDDHGIAVQERPAYTFATSRVGELRARAELAAARQAGLDVAWTRDTGLPFATRGAVRLGGQLQLHPIELLDALVDALLAAGGTVHEHTRVRRVSRDGQAVQAHTDQGTVTADRLVVATSMPILDRAGHFARQTPQRSYAAAMRSTWMPPGMYLSADSPIRSIRSAAGPDGELLLVGGHGHVTGRTSSEAERVSGLIGWARDELGGAEVTHTWSAQDQSPMAELPYVGPLLPGDDRVLVATGYDKWGLTNAPAAALLLAATVLGGHRPDWARAMSSWSPWELTGVPRGVVHNATVGYRMAEGWLRTLGGDADAPPPEGKGGVHHGTGHPVARCTVDGVTHTVSALCSHLLGVVRWNDAERSWDCPLHGSRFAPDGSVLEGPATRPLAPR
jgi:glycine/D-amino acid oxidase-like deaminating enzyme/nitrite reductase/ring-hydroxylating ferredoxin subunit